MLVVANRTASTKRLLDEIARRAEGESTRFTLLIPDAPNRKAADWTLEVAIPLLRRAARGPVDHLLGGPEPFVAIQQAVREHEFDEIIISTLPRRTSKWLRSDLIHASSAWGFLLRRWFLDAPRPASRIPTSSAIGLGGGMP